jgi:hypothetical protein
LLGISRAEDLPVWRDIDKQKFALEDSICASEQVLLGCLQIIERSFGVEVLDEGGQS